MKLQLKLFLLVKTRQLLPHRPVCYGWNRIMRSNSGSKLEFQRRQMSGCLLTIQVSLSVQIAFSHVYYFKFLLFYGSLWISSRGTSQASKKIFFNEIFFGFRDSESGEVRVYPGKLQVSEPFCIVPVTETTTVADLIEEALQRFGLQNFKSEDYRCSEILLDRDGECQFDLHK